MPVEGVKLSPDINLLTLEERKRTLSLFSSLGMTKLRFTGGEPTISKQLLPLIEYANNLSSIKSIGITTNGLTLASNIDKYIDAGLTNVNISLDTLNPDKFAYITKREKTGFSKVLSSIYSAIGKKELSNSLQSVKINCVLIRNFNDNEIVEFVKFTKEFNVDIRFIEMMPFQGNNWDKNKLITYIECISLLKDKNINLESITKDRF
jgi:cyclic pyranopterin phosphate synthase